MKPFCDKLIRTWVVSSTRDISNCKHMNMTYLYLRFTCSACCSDICTWRPAALLSAPFDVFPSSVVITGSSASLTVVCRLLGSSLCSTTTTTTNRAPRSCSVSLSILSQIQAALEPSLKIIAPGVNHRNKFERWLNAICAAHLPYIKSVSRGVKTITF